MIKFIRKYAWTFWAGAALTGFFGPTVRDPYFWIYTIVLIILVMIIPKDSFED